MLAKKKKCDGECGQITYIWKNQGGKRYCKSCSMKKHRCANNETNTKPTKKQYTIPPRSSKKAKLDLAYTILRKKYLENKPMCEAHFPLICLQQANEIHHIYSGSNRNQYFLDTTTWLSICRNCHSWIHNNPSKAREMNYLK